jgi:superfamily I DNA/RNA helicase
VDKAMAIAAEKGLTLSEVFARGSEFPEIQEGAVAAVAKLQSTIRELRPFSTGPQLVDMIRLLVRDVNYKAEVTRCYPDEKTRNARWGAVNEILNMAENYVRRNRKGTLSGLLEELTLSATDEADSDEHSRDSVTLMTLHSAKGLEFPQVYLVGVEEGLLPHIRSMQDGDVDEERRLAYVGITRARQRLTLSYTKSRARYGKRVATMRSRFIYEMNGETPPLHELVAIMEMMGAGKREPDASQSPKPQDAAKKTARKAARRAPHKTTTKKAPARAPAAKNKKRTAKTTPASAPPKKKTAASRTSAKKKRAS